MKRVACLFLCFLLLFIGCQKEELPKTPAKAPGDDTPEDSAPTEEFVPEIEANSFYTYDGDLHNVYVNLTLTTTELTAPVSELSFELRNDSEYYIYFLDSITQGYKWELWENGAWKAFVKDPWNTNEIAINEQLTGYMAVNRTENFTIPLEAGVYRLRLRYWLTNEKTEPQIVGGAPGIECVVETYFTILPAPEA